MLGNSLALCYISHIRCDEHPPKFTVMGMIKRELTTPRALRIAPCVHRGLSLMCCLSVLPGIFRVAGARWPQGWAYNSRGFHSTSAPYPAATADGLTEGAVTGPVRC